ncbi:hypothetical protein F0562_027137 [Nyssa sinensis]|uniref:HVA22-like protein n=1 Tax=Nyssa sinensis TaxID=561372 RepID=A0A5J5B474_9ASTE|nr:hypothetical protein F0562_027137 [Nyssa sinensis]
MASSPLMTEKESEADGESADLRVTPKKRNELPYFSVNFETSRPQYNTTSEEERNLKKISKQHDPVLVFSQSLSLSLSLHFTCSADIATDCRRVKAVPLVRTPVILLKLQIQNKHRKAYKMIGSFLTRGLSIVFGYAYPAYECFKTVEKNKPEIEQLRFWCQYWILVSVLTVCERIGDTFISWIPMYSEAKLAFFIYLWYPKTRGTAYVYDSFFRPYVAKHETEIDRNLLELRTRAGDIAVLYWQKAASYGQTRIFEILQYVASQSTPRPRPAQPQQQGARVRQPAATTPHPTEEPPSPTSSTSSSEHEQEEVAQELGLPQGPTAASPVVGLNAQKTTAGQPPVEITKHSNSDEAEAMQMEPVSSSATENVNPPPQETVMEEVVRVTRGRLRKTRAAANR